METFLCNVAEPGSAMEFVFLFLCVAFVCILKRLPRDLDLAHLAGLGIQTQQ